MQYIKKEMIIMNRNVKNKETEELSSSVVFRYLFFAGCGIGLFALLGVFLGTFTDLKVSEALFTPGALFWRIITAVGMFPFLGLFVFYLGAICRQAFLSPLSGGRKIAAVAVSGLLGLSTAAVGAWSMCRADSLGTIFPQVIGNLPVVGAFAVLVMVPLFLAGFFLSEKEFDSALLKELICLCLTMTLALACMESLKIFFCRPRYRLLLQEYPGITFTPWYQRFAGSKELIAEYNIPSNDFKSFPSGHTILAMSLIYALPPLAEVTGHKENRKVLLGLFAAGAAFALFVAVSRLILGAHFLSDVSMGACIAVFFGCILFLREAKHKTV